MVVLDTYALIYDALTPKRLGEIAMLVHKKRLDPGIDTLTFIRLALEARAIRMRALSPEVADLSASFPSTTTRLTGSSSRRRCWNTCHLGHV